MTSPFAELVLLLSVPFSICVFFFMSPLTATLLVALGSEMFLPSGPEFKFPLMPALSKMNLPYLCILIGLLLSRHRKTLKLPKDRVILGLGLAALIGGAFTGLTNGDSTVVRSTGVVAVIHAMDLKDGIAVGVGEFFPAWLAVYLGYNQVRNAKEIEKALVWLAVSGLVYSFFALFEIRMSPQINGWVYGYPLTEWAQMIRWGGYRPQVFMTHGLSLARFFVMTTLSLFVLAKVRRRLFGIPVRLLAWFHFVVLVLCRSTGAIVIGLVGVLLVSLTRPRRQLIIASVLTVATLAYPVLRATDLFPTSSLLSAAGELSEERRGSLAFRFVNEDVLLAHARERVWFGWGSYGRNVIVDDAGNGEVMDGYWIITLGIAGVVGLLVGFGLIAWPCLLAPQRLRGYGDKTDRVQMAGMSVILVLTMLDWIPNGMWFYFPYLFAGMMLRRMHDLQHSQTTAAATCTR